MKCIPVETITKNLIRAHLTYEDGTEGLGYTSVCFGSVIKNEDYLIDAVPVVRCKNCEHYMTIHCVCDGCCISDDWFCASGKRKEAEE